MATRRACLMAMAALAGCALFSAPARAQSASATVRSAPRIYLSEPLTAPSPTEFAKKLSDLVGATIDLPSIQIVLVIPSRSYSPDELIVETAKQLSDQLGVSVTWSRSFVLARPEPNKAALPFRLSSAGNISYDCTSAPFDIAAKAIAADAHCGLDMPSDIPSGKFSLHVALVPAESAMRELAADAGLTMTVRVTYQMGKPLPGALSSAAGDADSGQADDSSASPSDDDVAVSADSGPIDLDTPDDPDATATDIGSLSAWSLENADLPDGTDGSSFGDWLATNSSYAGIDSGSDSGSYSGSSGQ